MKNNRIIRQFEFFDEISENLQLCSQKILNIYENYDQSIEYKDDKSPLTEADLASHQQICDLLSSISAYPIISEEGEQKYTDEPKYWLVDPLDGTKEFINNTGEFTVNIAYIQNGSPTHGTVYAPAIKRLFSTDHNSKSYETVKSSAKTGQIINKPLRVSKANASALTVVASKSHINSETNEYIANYSVSSYKNAGSSLKFCLIANGEADFYPRLGRTMEWDTAAGHAILSGAGGYVTNLFTKEPLYYGKPGFENPFFVAHSNKSLIKH